MTRDPRIDPVRGDIVRSGFLPGIGGRPEYLVVDNDGVTVTYVENGQHVLDGSIEEWREYSVGDEIVRRGDAER